MFYCEDDTPSCISYRRDYVVETVHTLTNTHTLNQSGTGKHIAMQLATALGISLINSLLLCVVYYTTVELIDFVASRGGVEVKGLKIDQNTAVRFTEI